MKITDYSIIFATILVCLISIITLKSNVAYEYMYINNRYNVIVDNAIEDALRAAYESVDKAGKPIVNLRTAYEFFMNEISVMLDGNSMFQEYYEDRIKLMVYTADSGYYYRDNKNSWSEMIYYEEKENTPHSQKVNELIEFVKQKYEIVLNVPYNEGESYINTITDFTLIAIYEDYDGLYCFSAAKLTEKAHI